MITSNPYDELLKLKESVDGLLESVGGETTGIRAPLVDIEDTKDSLIIFVELPGIKKEDIKLTLMENAITVVTEKRDIDEKRKFYLMERQYVNYFRLIPLPEDIKLEGEKTVFDNGVLEIYLKKKNKKPQMKALKIG